MINQSQVSTASLASLSLVAAAQLLVPEGSAQINPNPNSAVPSVEVRKLSSPPNSLGLVVEHRQTDTMRLSFSDDLKNWFSNETCSCVIAETFDAGRQPAQGNIIKTFRFLNTNFNPPFGNKQMFARAEVTPAPDVAHKLRGLAFSPYTAPDENPNFNRSGQITREELVNRIALVAPYTRWLRSYGLSPDLQPIGEIAHQFGLKSAIGAWISADLDNNQREIDKLVELAIKGDVDIAIVGSEVLLRGDLSEEKLIEYINTTRQRLRDAGITIPVVTAEVYGIFRDRPNLVAATDIIAAHIYPYWEGRGLQCAVAYLNQGYQSIAQLGKPVIVAETGWPSCGNRIGEAVPSPENAAEYMHTFISWAEANNVEYFAFSALNEGWKVPHEGPQGACWGNFKASEAGGVPNPGLEPIFRGERVSSERWLNCSSGVPNFDVFNTPQNVDTNLRDYFFAGQVTAGQIVKVNDVALGVGEIADNGIFAFTRPLQAGTNVFKLEVFNQDPTALVRSIEKTITTSESTSTAAKRLIYVDVVAGLNSAFTATGAVVIDVESHAVLGIIPHVGVRAISKDNPPELYLSDRRVISSADHRTLRELPFDSNIGGSSMVLTDKYIVSGNQVVNRATNTREPDLATSIYTGDSWAGAQVGGGPAAGNDGETIYFGRPVQKLNLATREITNTGLGSVHLGDITLSPDGDTLALTSYAFANGALELYNPLTLERLAVAGSLGDFIGEVDFFEDRAIVGSSGNPAFGQGYLSVVDIKTGATLSQISAPLGNNLTVSDRGEVFSTIGQQPDGVVQARQGVNVSAITPDGQINLLQTYFLGVNYWVTGFGSPEFDQIEKIIYKP